MVYKVYRLCMGIVPRGYQVEAVEAVRDAYREGIGRQLISLPTGTGKTIVFGLLAKEMGVKTLILAHRENLIEQAVSKVGLVYDTASIGVCMAGRNELDADIVVGSVQSCCRDGRLAQLKEQNFQLLVIDEAHHACSDSYKNIISSLGFFNGKLLVGVTATPYRSDTKGLGDVFEKVVFDRSIGLMVRAGYLSDIKGKRVLTRTDLTKVHTRMGDFVESELSEACNTFERNNLICNTFLEECPERKSIAFTCNVDHAKSLASVFQDKGYPAEAIYGALADDKKQEVYERFRRNETKMLINCALLTEGFDEPDISCVLMCRPTKSSGLYTQCVGRGTRLYPGKKDCLILDFCDRVHDIQKLADLSKTLNISYTEDDLREASDDFEGEKNNEQKVFVGEEIIESFDFLERSKINWIQSGKNWMCQIDAKRSMWLIQKDSGYLPCILEDSLESIAKNPLDLNYSMGIAEDFIRKNEYLSPISKKNQPWMLEPPSQKQVETLEKMGIFDIQTKGEASKILSLKFNERKLMGSMPATPKQIYFLKRNGIEKEGLTKNEASRMIAGLKN
jgi:ATP-dependent helicase IRC3